MAISKLNPFNLVLHHHNPTPNPKPPNLPLLLLKDASTHSLKAHLNFPNSLPKIPSKTAINENEEENTDSLSVAFPALAFSNILFYASNATVVVGEDEGEEKLISRFRREVLKARVLQECRRRRFFECSQEKRKRKSREAARRYRQRRPQPNERPKDKAETSSKKKTQDTNDDDNWEAFDMDLPYC